MADRNHEVGADEMHQAAQASSQDLFADAKQDGSHSAVDLELHMVPVGGGSLIGHLADSNSDHEMLNSQAGSVGEDRLESAQARKYYLVDYKQDLQRNRTLLCSAAGDDMADEGDMDADHLIPLAEVCVRDCHYKATVQVARKP